MIYKSLAVLIDADNISHKFAAGLFDELAKICKASLKRIYGDFSDANLNGWAKILNSHAIIPQQQFANTVGKNSSDIALVIDAMDLLHTGRFDSFCLVSSDSDFTRLAARIREQGVDVYGIGEKKAPESFRQACTRFIFTENFGVSEENSATAIKSIFLPPSKAVPFLRKAISEMEPDIDGWYRLSTVGSVLNNLSSEFDPRSYGQPNLSALVAATGQFLVDHKGPYVRMRIKPPKNVVKQKSV